MIQVSAEGLLSILKVDSSVYPLMIDIVSEKVLLARIPEESRSEASFLDQRVMTSRTEGAWCAWSQFAEAARSFGDCAPGYIFHVGHCGSTLISRLVALATGAAVLREPTPLRTFACDAAETLTGSGLLSWQERRRRLELFERLWARSGVSVVKATSICTCLINEVSPSAPVAFVYVAPEIYLAAVLGGANSHIDLRGFGQLRMRRLRQIWGGAGDLASLSPGELAAMSWLSEVVPIAIAKRPVLTVDFDAFLADPAVNLKQVCAHLCGPVSDDAVTAALASGVMGRYSKAPEQAYDARLRARHLAEDRAARAGEIRAGMRWLEAAAKAFPAGETSLRRFGAKDVTA
jgi:hypothetical protein